MDRPSQLDDDDGVRGSSFNYSAPTRHSSSSHHGGGTRASLMDRNIIAAPLDPRAAENTTRSPNKVYKGRLRRWPGVLLLIVIVGGAIAAIAYFSVSKGKEAHDRAFAVQKRLAKERSIADGLTSGSGSDEVDVDEDGQVNNPKVYPPASCQQPDYQSKNGKIYAVAKNGTEVSFQIKGVNWFGMETGLRSPFGLWDNEQNGTTVYAIAQFLAKNKFNSVRIPLCVESILNNKAPELSIINRVTNRALDLTSYLGLLGSVTESLGYRQISVMISMHTLDLMNAGGSLWYGKSLTADEFLKAIDMLTTALCSDKHWNILGVDVKNEPWEGTWGDGSKKDFKLGAELIGARILKGCPKWLVFVEGVNAQHTVVLDGQEFGYYDWYGGGLQKAGDYPVVLPAANKLVYAPHYYNPAVFPQAYLVGGGKTLANNAISNYTELDDEKLLSRVSKTMHHMFGYLNDGKGPAVVLGEFGGLYTQDLHPKKTTQRCSENTIKTMVSESYAGGYMWCLNPESAYQYNPMDTPGNYIEGLLNKDWRSVNAPFLKAMNGMDAFPDLKMTPCFPNEP